MSEVKIVRMGTGEEMIGKVTNNGDSCTIKNPAIIIPAGEGKIGLAPYLPYADIEDGLEVHMNHIMFIAKPMKEFVNEYNAAFGSGIVVPTGPMGGPMGDEAFKDAPPLKLTT